MFIIKCLMIGAMLFVGIALVLIVSQSRSAAHGSGLDFSRQSAPAEIAGEVSIEPRQFVARDGAALFYHQYQQISGAHSNVVIILLHGSSAHSGLYKSLAAGLTAAGTVISPDIRGHGRSSPGGDVDYIGQLEDDLADLIEHLSVNDEQKLVIAGHSSGGGLAVRYGGNSALPQPDGMVLLAPYLGYNSPTTRTDSGGWAMPLTRRIVGLTMLNALGFRALNYLPVISFSLPENGEALGMTAAYTYRLNTSFAPRRDFKQELSSLPAFTVIIGAKDEAFIAGEYAPLLQSFANAGSVRVIDELSHLDVISNADVHQQAVSFISGL